MTRQVLLLFLVGAGVVLPGCGGDSATVPASTSPTMPDASAPGPDDGASTVGLSGTGGPEVFQEVPGDDAQGLLSRLVLYFEFDQSDIVSEFNAMLAAHGEYLATNADAQVRLEGHADERGSREYNIGLGEERSQAVRRVLLLQGAATAQLSTVSYGEERPASVGSSEEAYSLNRRVELVYRQ
ncbi:MAG: peptidoglycan-associated lipoprotein Pal [Gammaproteobacteria bacterium]